MNDQEAIAAFIAARGITRVAEGKSEYVKIDTRYDASHNARYSAAKIAQNDDDAAYRAYERKHQAAYIARNR